MIRLRSAYHLRSLALLSVLAVLGGPRGSAGWPSAAAAQASAPTEVAPWDSTPLVRLADIDSSVSPCNDFYQYATGGWYRRKPTAIADSVEVVGPDLRVIGSVLREYVAAAPALVSATSDPATRLLGELYGSCLTDTTGTAEGAAGDGKRGNACFRKTRDLLDIALASVLFDRVWPADARAESRTMWTSMTQAATRRIQSSSALRDNTKQRLTDVVASTQLVVGDEPAVPFLLLVDSIAPEWDRVAKNVYAKLDLSRSDFPLNVRRLQGVDSLVAPSLRRPLRRLLDDLLDGTGAYYTSTGSPSVISMAARSLIPPRVNGNLDLGAWYGFVGAALLGHEITHPLDFLPDEGVYGEDMIGFAREQWRGQLEIRVNAHYFDDFFGALIAYDAFERIIRGKQRRRIEGFTPEQRFFLGAAQSVLGGALTEESISASHSATRWRVYTNGTLSAMPGFAQAFGCKKGDRMAGGHVWYRAPWYGVTLTPEEQRARYREFYIDHYTEIARGFFNDANYLAQNTYVELTDAQATKLTQIAATTHPTQWDALAASLRTVTDNADGNRRVLRLLAQQLKDLRADLDLTPEQRGSFDQLMKAWMQQYLPGD